MSAKRIFTIRNIVAVILAGALGDILGVLLRYFFPKSPARDAILYTVKVGIPDITLNLLIIHLKFGFMFTLNLLTFVLIFLMIYILQKI